MKRVLAITVVALALFYLADALAASRSSLGTVTVNQSYAIPLKNGQISYMPGEIVDVPCAHSLLPHRHAAPCWYLRRHTEQQITIDTGSQVNNPH